MSDIPKPVAELTPQQMIAQIESRGLSRAEFLKAETEAQGRAKLAHPEPKEPKRLWIQYLAQNPGKLLVLLIIFFLFAVFFTMTMIKQVTASDSIFAPVFKDNSYFSTGWLSVLIFCACSAGEFGSIAMIHAAFQSDDKRERIGYLVFAFLCSALAIVANFSYGLFEFDFANKYFLYGWMLTGIPPFAVLALSQFLERTLARIHKELQAFVTKARDKWKREHKDWEAINESLLTNDSYKQLLFAAVYAKMRSGRLATNGDRFDALLDKYPESENQFLRYIIRRQVAKWSVDFSGADKENPTSRSEVEVPSDTMSKSPERKFMGSAIEATTAAAVAAHQDSNPPSVPQP